jgi:hypothetical protein
MFRRLFRAGLLLGLSLTGTKVMADDQDIIKVHWPYVYPAKWKAGIGLGRQQIRSKDSSLKAALAPGVSFEILMNKNFLFGISMDYIKISSTVPGLNGRIINSAATIGFMIPLDDYEIHHFVISARPALAFSKTTSGSRTSVGFGLGFQYEYTLFSNNIISPEIVYQRFPMAADGLPSIGRWKIGFRYLFGK